MGKAIMHILLQTHGALLVFAESSVDGVVYYRNRIKCPKSRPKRFGHC